MTGQILRLAGIIQLHSRGPLLRTDEGAIWRLETDGVEELPVGRPVTVEGVQRGETIAAYYCAPRATGSPC